MSTWTNPVYDLTRIPLVVPEYGVFNTELGEAVYKTVSENSALWDQQTWRSAFTGLDGMDATQEEAVRHLTPIGSLDTCGTAMCFAGWTGEITGADWVVDRSAILGELTANAEMVMVTREWLDRHAVGSDALAVYSMDKRALHPDVLAHLKSRGFDSRVHAMIPVESYARIALGLVDGDWRDLFGSENTMENIREILDLYEEHGTLRPVSDYAIVDEVSDFIASEPETVFFS